MGFVYVFNSWITLILLYNKIKKNWKKVLRLIIKYNNIQT